MIKERIDADKIGSWGTCCFEPPDTWPKLADCGVVANGTPRPKWMASALNYLGLDPHSEDSADLEKAVS